VTQVVSINSDNTGFIDPGFFRLKSNACLVLTEPGGLGVYCATFRENTIGSIQKESQIHFTTPELSAYNAGGMMGNADERRYDHNDIIDVFHADPVTYTHQTQQPEVST